MSSSSDQWPVMPGMAYIIKLGDYTHVLSAADQLSSDHLNLSQLAVRNIDLARNLLNERGPFLLAEKQQKMDEAITDTEEAIERVIKLIEPARFEKITRDTIRIPDLWALRDEPRSAATFSRLRSTHDRLKTVVHDLKNIEATAQLDDCNTRAANSADTPNRQHATPNVAATPSSTEARNLLTWKRSRRINRHGQTNSNVSSVSGLTAEDRDANDLQSPISLPPRSPGTPGDSTAQPRRDSASLLAALSPTDSTTDHASEVSVNRLTVIHELEGGTIIELGPVKPSENASQDDDLINLSEIMQAPSKIQQPNTENDGAEERQGAPPNPNNESPGPNTMSTQPALTSKQNGRMKRETFEDYRRRNRESRTFTTNGAVQAPQSPAAVVSESVPRGDSRSGKIPEDSRPPKPGRFNSLNAKFPVKAAHRAQKSENSIGRQPQSNGTHPQDTTVQSHVINEFSQRLKQRGMYDAEQFSHQANTKYGAPSESTSVASKPATYPPAQMQSNRQSGALQIMPDGVPQIGETPTTQYFSPSKTQMSPLEQSQSPQNSRPMGLVHRQSTKHYEIVTIDPELLRLPSVLRPARSKELKPPYPPSNASSEQPDELYLTESPQASPGKDSLGRQITAPPSTHSLPGEVESGLADSAAKDDIVHHRSKSDTVVPQINVIRVPTVPRKPLPYRSSPSPSPSRNPSPIEVSRANTPERRRRSQSESILPGSDFHETTKTGSGPPSPIASERRDSLIPPRSRAASIHSLQVQAPSSGESSRRSSVSATDSPRKQSMSKERAPVTNPLAMHPPDISNQQQSAYQAQSSLRNEPPTQASVDVPADVSPQSPVSQPDYRSPAFMQSRHYVDPRHNMHLVQTSPAAVESPSRFRDSDQSNIGPIDPARSRTEPFVAPNAPVPVPQPAKARRASEQPKHSFLRHQAATMLARAKTPANYQPNPQSRPEPQPQASVQGPTQPQPRPQPQQQTQPQSQPQQQALPQSFHQAATQSVAQPVRQPAPQPVAQPAPQLPNQRQYQPVLPSTAQQASRPTPPPASQSGSRIRNEQPTALRVVLTPNQQSNMTRPGPPVPDVEDSVGDNRNNYNPHNESRQQQNNQQSMNDRQQFSQHMFRAQKGKQRASSPPSDVSTPTATTNGHHHPHAGHTHECHCDSELSSPNRPTQALDKPATEQPRIPAVPAGSVQPNIQPQPPNPDNSAAAAVKNRKKKSWLIHQASKMAGRQAST